MTAALAFPDMQAKPFDLESAIAEIALERVAAMRAAPPLTEAEEIELMLKAVNEGWFVEYRRERDAERKMGER